MPSKLYLHPKYNPTAYIKSAHHRAFVSDGAVVPEGQPPHPLHVVDFWGGVARDVDDQVAQRLIDAGIANYSRPKIPGIGDDD